MNVFARPQRKQQSEETLLRDLLMQAPAREALRGPVALRSTDEQRHLALRAFLRRTWVDAALHHTERLLLLAGALVFAFWLLNGYGHDWLHAHSAMPRHMAAFAQSYARLVPRARALSATALLGEQASSATALPFTSPQVLQQPEISDFLAPQMMGRDAARPDPDDRRPTRLLLPAIAVDTPVREVFVENDTWQVADYAAGYHHGSALPGDAGNMVMAGHAGVRGSIFRHLGRLAAGDDILVDAAGWRYRYRVRELVRAWPTQVELMAPTPTPVLTLITCTEWDSRRLVVIADLVGSRPLEER